METGHDKRKYGISHCAASGLFDSRRCPGEAADYSGGPKLPPQGSVPAERLRERWRNTVKRFPGRPVLILHVEDRSILGPLGSIPLRVYRPSDEAKLPIMLCYHGGGFTWGDLDTHDQLCRKLSNRSGAIVVSVAYRLAPEHVFPAAVEDAYLYYPGMNISDLHTKSMEDFAVGYFLTPRSSSI